MVFIALTVEWRTNVQEMLTIIEEIKRVHNESGRLSVLQDLLILVGNQTIPSQELLDFISEQLKEVSSD